MNSEDHRLAAEDDEAAIPILTASAIGERANRMIIEGRFGSAFHWIAYKCDRTHGKHKNNHTKLVSFLTDVGEPEIAERWRVLSVRSRQRSAKRPKPVTSPQSLDAKRVEGARSADELGPYPAATVAPWLDHASAAQVDAIVDSVVSRHPDLRAAILFGSVARHDERPLEDTEPSDVDLLLLFDRPQRGARLSFEERLAISHAIVSGMRQQPEAPREVNVFTSVADLSEWHEDFIANLIHDGVALWARRPLPALLTSMDQRADERELAAPRGA